MRLQQASDDLRLAWPDAVAYREAIQSPTLSVGDPLLAGAAVAQTRQGLPLAYTGRFAIVFRLLSDNQTAWAFRCFTSPGDPYGVSRGTRYRLLATYLERLPDLFVPYRVAERGIRVAGKWYPTLAMRWADGVAMGNWVEANRANPERLRRLAGTLSATLARLEDAGIAHGDWQHDNLLVSEFGDAVTLVDYDGMFVPDLAGYPAPELGHPNYQHPERSERHYEVGLDRFACLTMRAALLGLARQPELWERYGDGESILFKASDFRDPDKSPLFAELRALVELDRDEELADALARLADACRAGADNALLPPLTTRGPKPLPQIEVPDELDTQTDGGRRHFDGGWQTLLTAEERAAQEKWWEGMRPVRTIGMQTQAADTFRFLEQLESVATQKRETQLLWKVRVLIALGVAAFVALCATLGMSSGAAALFGLIALLIWAANVIAVGFVRWPRRLIQDELFAETGRMGQLVAERRDRVAHRTAATSRAVDQATRLSLADYVAEKMRQIAINRLLSVPNVNVATIKLLREEGIQTALDLSRRSVLTQVPPHQIQQLQNWCRTLEQDYADEHRRYTAAARNAQVDVQRLEMEIAEFSREIDKLARERERFPGARLATYLQRLFFLNG